MTIRGSARTARTTQSGKHARRLHHGQQPGQLVTIPLDQIDVPKRPARRFLGDIASLAESMQDYGLQQPISVREVGGRFELTSGLRRYSAAKMLGWLAIPAFVRNVTADDAYVVDLVENLQRQDLSPEEEADALGQLLRARGWTLEQVAAAIKRSVGYVSKRVRIFEDPALRDAITRRGLPVSTAEELLAVPAEQRASAAERALAERWDQTTARAIVSDRNDAMPMIAFVPSRQERGSGSGAGRRQPSHGELTAPADNGGQRPRGFTRAVREFHRMILTVGFEDLSPADRAALRALFRDLVMLARATTNGARPVFPPLPSVPSAPSRRRA